MHEIRLPQLGQSVEEASIVKWFKQEGEVVRQGEPLFSIQTDKAEIECESSASGVLRKILLEPDVTVPVLTVVGLVGEAGEPLPDLGRYRGAGTAGPQDATQAATTVAPSLSPAVAEAQEAIAEHEKFISPRAKALAEELRIDAGRLPGTGAGGRVIEADIRAAAEKIKTIRTTPTARRLAEAKGIDITGLAGTGARGRITKQDVGQAAERATAAPAGGAGAVRRVLLTPMRRIIAKRMSESFYSAPHYYVTVEVDMAAAIRFREEIAGFRPSFNDLIMFAAARAMQKFPQVNVRWAGDAVEEVADINLGFAVALPTGLIVPVVRRAQDKSLQGIHEECQALSDKARAGKLLPDDCAGHTFTISNLGGLGVDQFTAIINPPDSAILAVGRIKDCPVVIAGAICVRPMMKVTLSSDHRVIDGAVAAQFLAALKDILETGALTGESHG